MSGSGPPNDTLLPGVNPQTLTEDIVAAASRLKGTNTCERVEFTDWFFATVSGVFIASVLTLYVIIYFLGGILFVRDESKPKTKGLSEKKTDGAIPAHVEEQPLLH